MIDYKLQNETADLKRRMRVKEGDVLRTKRLAEDAHRSWEQIHARANKLREELAREEHEETEAKKKLEEAQMLLGKHDKEHQEILSHLNHLSQELQREVEASKNRPTGAR